ncbi:hypothetical protein M0638_10340 [Roseomonas sp. NAR14]|uniref:Glycosyltransferase n=1 Tax=Roseomonas acroporae TaxID=2937791 RepID=A0A9X2BV68_9PROT|nr:hypothetical protein [Roseomonas acroporae]MCK8784781.1 hypothetical protein [Roseomonas acroporae]
MRPVGYYVHHQGAGHLARAVILARRMRRPVTLIGTMDAAAAAAAPLPVLALPDDAPAPDPGAGEVPGLHYAPRGHDGLRRRGAAIAAWIAAHRPALLVVDVSVEVAMLARLLSTPVVYVRLAGRRDDAPHLGAFRAAEALLAPFPAALEDAATPGWVLKRSFHAGFLAAPPPRPAAEPDSVVVAFGRGGAGGDGEALAAAARAVPWRRWRVLGPATMPAALPPNLEFLGWREDAPTVLARAGLVVGGCGDGLLAEVAALGRPFLCLPEPRPFDEQGAKARRLAALGAAVVREAWPAAGDWPALLREAEALDTARIAALYDPDAPRRAADFLDETADRAERHGQRAFPGRASSPGDTEDAPDRGPGPLRGGQ